MVKIFSWWLIIFSLPLCVLTNQRNKSVLDTIVETMKYAKTYIDIAKDVANLVSQSLNEKTQRRREETKTFKTDEHSFVKHSFIHGFFRMLKLDSSKVLAIAVNSVIFLAQLISTLFEVKTTGINQEEESKIKDNSPKWDPMKYILENQNERVKRLVLQAQDPDLPNQLINRVNGYESSCVRLLLCKTSPIIWAAQKSLKDKSVFKNRKLTSWLPNWTDFESNWDSCEDKHIDCNLFPDT